MSYLVIPRIRIQNANALPTWWMIGPPAMTAYAGFSQAIALTLGLKTYQGFGVIHHDIQFLGEYFGVLKPHQFRAATLIDHNDYSSKNKYGLSSQPTARCHLTLSFVVHFNDEDGLDLEDALPRFMRRARIAGGSVIEHGKISLLENMDQVISFLKTGYAIHERQDLMTLSEEDQDMLDVVLRLTNPLERFKSKKANTDAEEADSFAWLMPTCLGYQAITDFQERKNAREGLLHAFAEPLVGMVQYQSIRRKGIPMWKMVNLDTQTFVVTTNHERDK